MNDIGFRTRPKNEAYKCEVKTEFKMSHYRKKLTPRQGEDSDQR